jgi:hypothetical protein
LVKSKQLETSAIPTKENFADLGTKKLSKDRMHYLMNGVGVYDEGTGELVGAEVVAKDKAANDFRGVLRVLRESIGDDSNHTTMVSAKKTLRALLLLTLVNVADALSLESPMSFFMVAVRQLSWPFTWRVFTGDLVLHLCCSSGYDAICRGT